jgi:hypothetical protein
MKKLLFAFFAVCIMTTSFAADVPHKWLNFTAEEHAALKAYTKDHKYDNYKMSAKLEKFSKSNPKVYTDFTIFEQWINDLEKEGVIEKPKVLIAQVALQQRNLFDTPTYQAIYKKYNEAYFVIYSPNRCLDKIASLYPSKLDIAKDMIARIKSTKRPRVLKEILAFIQANCMDEDEAKLKATLKQIKRMYYANLSKSEEWKKLLVDLELLMKPLE